MDRAARDVDRLEYIDELLVEAFDIVIVQRADNGGEGPLGLCEGIFCVLGGIHGSDGKGVALKARVTRRERSGERGDRAVVNAAKAVGRYLN